MTWAIFPIAGPDVYSSEFCIRPLYDYNGSPLIAKAIESRPWFIDESLIPSKMIFVVLDGDKKKQLIEFLSNRYPKCHFVVISAISRGALLSAIAGVSLIHDFASPIIVDLTDIIYTWSVDIQKEFSQNQLLGAIVPYFRSSQSKYSYLAIQDGFVHGAVEKKVISSNASAGTYVFRNLSTLLAAAADSLEFEHLYSVKSNMFVCPSLNGVIRNKRTVLASEVQNIEEVSLIFHKEG